MSFTCSVCCKTFNFSKDLKRHADTVHKNDFYDCVLCDKKFSRKDNVKRHVQRVHFLKGDVQSIVNYGASTSKHYQENNSRIDCMNHMENEKKIKNDENNFFNNSDDELLKEFIRKKNMKTGNNFSDGKDSDDDFLLETAKKIDPTPTDVEIVNVYPGDSKNWIERFSEDIEFEDVCVENEMTGTGIPHAQQTKQSIPNSKKINLIIILKIIFHLQMIMQKNRVRE
ncbi:uncharacterized protein LOC126897650 [Daktulosphaira vitifoliae]|uniref:uncharacterized protein LOC126897650 n=1 Tax=Daktulosphaira vitifoliae TaxID=58002 RepID=UPI0021AABCA9|nr:uncharacterized protein LOC126897650 [Daktulosphaira vitifoliae]XP_050527375.1 uncharacterized protein LOC126897650 [Daktulosphaira vitifoliae]